MAELASTSDLWHRETDVVVVGSGAAGMAAALAAASEGAAVVILEKASHRGGTTAKSGGGFWIPNNTLMRAAGIEDPKDQIVRYMARFAYPYRYVPHHETLGLPAPALELIETYYDNASLAIDHFTAIGAIEPELGPTPSYHADLPEDVAPRGRSLRSVGTPARKA